MTKIIPKDNKKNIVFVCTGNICRSPMAEAYFRYKCNDESSMEITIKSAGIYATVGHEPSILAQQVLAEKNIPFAGQKSSPLTPEMVQQADLIVAMAKVHADQILTLYPGSKSKLFTLLNFIDSTDDIEDPYGSTRIMYEECFNKMQPALDALFQKIKD